MYNLDLKVFSSLAELKQYLLEFFRACYTDNNGFIYMAEKYLSPNEQSKLVDWLNKP